MVARWRPNQITAATCRSCARLVMCAAPFGRCINKEGVQRAPSHRRQVPGKRPPPPTHTTWMDSSFWAAALLISISMLLRDAKLLRLHARLKKQRERWISYPRRSARWYNQQADVYICIPHLSMRPKTRRQTHEWMKKNKQLAFPVPIFQSSAQRSFAGVRFVSIKNCGSVGVPTAIIAKRILLRAEKRRQNRTRTNPRGTVKNRQQKNIIRKWNHQMRGKYYHLINLNI